MDMNKNRTLHRFLSAKQNIKKLSFLGSEI